MKVSRDGKVVLQWGRDLTVADSHTASLSSLAIAMLQWGRDLTVADSDLFLGLLHGHVVASMGPRSDGRGQRVRVLPFACRYRRFNGAAI